MIKVLYREAYWLSFFISMTLLLRTYYHFNEVLTNCVDYVNYTF